MTCCEADIEYSALVCQWDPEQIKATLKNRTWAKITARVENRYHRIYGRKGPVLKPISVVPCPKPQREVATFY